MDPVSIIASSIAFAHALTKGIDVVRKTWKAGPELLALHDEISDLSIVLHDLLVLLHQRAHSHNSLPPNASLFRHTLASKTKLESIADSVATWKDATLSRRPAQRDQIRFRTLRISQKAKKFRDELILVKDNLICLFVVLSASTSSRIEIELRELLLTTQNAAVAQTELHAELKHCLNQLGNTSNNIAQSAIASAETSSIDREAIGPVDENEPPWTQTTIGDGDFRGDFVKAFHSNGPVLYQSRNMTAITAVGVRTASFPRQPCTAWCSCKCHTETRFRTPQFLDRVIGAFFLGFSGMPAMTRACDQTSCHLRSQPHSYVTYMFPPWFLARALSLIMSHTKLAGPVVSLKVQRTVPGSADIFTYAKTGEVEKMKNLFENGLASPFDVHFGSGVTALHLAIGHQRLNVCKFLLQANADPFIEDNARWAAVDTAWSMILADSAEASAKGAFRSMFSETECIERREFTVLHKIVLGLAPHDLLQQLKVSTADINVVDSNGRTPLSFAAERYDLEALSKLLQFGADVSILSRSGVSALHNAVWTIDPCCIEPLIAHGADVNARTDWDQTPLHFVAAYRNDPHRCRVLLDAGADPEIRDLDGMTAIDWTGISGNEAVAECLIAHGVNLYNEDILGNTVLVHAISGNRILVLDKVAPSWSTGSAYEVNMALQSRVLKAIVKDADLKTMKHLTSFPIRFTDSAIDLAGGRDTLINQINARSDVSTEMIGVLYDLLQKPQSWSPVLVAPHPHLSDSLSDEDEDDNWEDAVEN